MVAGFDAGCFGEAGGVGSKLQSLQLDTVNVDVDVDKEEGEPVG